MSEDLSNAVVQQLHRCKRKMVGWIFEPRGVLEDFISPVALASSHNPSQACWVIWKLCACECEWLFITKRLDELVIHVHHFSCHNVDAWLVDFSFFFHC